MSPKQPHDPHIVYRSAGPGDNVSSAAYVPRPALAPETSTAYTACKRIVDVLVSIVVLVGFSWLFVLIALLIKLTSRGPVLFVQPRVGSGGRVFPFFKFRSMIVGADAMRQDLEHLNEADGPVFKIKNDPRVTPLGRILRKFSLDELPQFVNVLVGHMSLVGPRPPLPSEVEKYGEREWMRLSVRPGLTCLWQINGRSEVSFDEWMDMDLDYIRRRSFWFDLAILVKTIPAVLAGRGAC